MSEELSITLTRLRKKAVSIAGSGRVNAQPVADVLSQRVVPEEGQPGPDFLAMQLGLVQMVETELARTEGLDESLVVELDDDREQLAERNDATDEVTDLLLSVQSACDGVYGAKTSRKLFGNVELLPRDPVVLAKLGRRVHRRLADPDYALPEAKLKGWALAGREAVATDLGDAVDRLDLALAALNDERKVSQGKRIVKTGALEDFRRTLRHAADCLASLYGLAGLDDLAAKIRPPRRRRRRTAGGSAGGSGSEPDKGQATESPAQAAGDASPEQPTGPTLVVS